MVGVIPDIDFVAFRLTDFLWVDISSRMKFSKWKQELNDVLWVGV